MRLRYVIAAGAAVLVVATSAVGGSSLRAVATDVAAADSRIEHGRYLVHEVAMCVQCHSPRDRRGVLIEERLLEGGPIPFKNPFQGARWAFEAPHIANLVGYTEEEVVHLLTQGIRRTGDRPAAPMPPFRMTREDAQAIWAYLQSR